MKPQKLILGIWACMCSLSSCIEKKDLYNEDYVNAVIEASFDYSLTLECPITLTYERRALIKIYDANPVNNPGARLLYGAYTDDNGNYNGTIVLPKQYLNKELYAYSKNIGVTYLLKSKVESNGLHFKVPESQARGIAQAPQHIPEILKQAVESELPEETDNRSKLSENNDINIKLTKDCSVDVIFIWSGAGTDWWTGMYNDDIANCQHAEDNNQWVNNDFSCDLYYFTYKEGELPTKEYIDTHIVGNSWQYVAWGTNQTTASWNGTYRRGISQLSKMGRIGWIDSC